MNFSNWKLYRLIIVFLSIVVIIVFSLYSWYLYTERAKVLNDRMLTDSELTLNSLKKNLAHFIEAYSVQEYELLIESEMHHADFQAIVVEDFNTANILGEPTYIVGRINEKNQSIIEFDSQNDEHLKMLKDCFYVQSTEILSSNDEDIGKVTICSTNYKINQELRSLLLNNLVVGLVFAIFLMLTLFFLLKKFAISPIEHIMQILMIQDKYGIPNQKIHEFGAYEFESLSQTINDMIDNAKESNKKLNDERKRFALAVEGTLDGLWDWDLKTDIVYHSERFETMLGYSGDELPNTIECWSGLLHPEDIDDAFKQVNEYLESKGSIPYESTFRMLAKSGEWRWITGRGKAIFDESGKAIRFVGFNSDITQAVEHQKALEHSAKHDSLTHLPNRFLFNELIQNMLYRSDRNQTGIALVFLDLDGFKEMNDKFGHEAGDQILIEVANRVKQLLRQEDVIARIGGDEFVFALSDVKNQNDISSLMHKVLSEINRPILYKNSTKDNLVVGASIGITTYPQDTSIGPEALLRQADQAMYLAKNSGKNKFHFFNIHENKSIQEQQDFFKKFQSAIENNEFELHYQPKVNMKTDVVIGFEALLRWRDPVDGMQYPDSFLPQVNNNDTLMLKLGQWVFSAAFGELSRWNAKNYNFTMSINISSQEFINNGTVKLIQALFKKHSNIKPEQIELEILETNALEDIEMAHQFIQKYQDIGLNIALDDFGTGYSTLSYLKNLPVDTLKIDKSFVMGMLNDSGSFSIIEAAMGLAHAFRCDVIAEGVESEEHGSMLIELGCTVAQGYAISKPLHPDKIDSWLSQWEPYPSWIMKDALPSEGITVLMALVKHQEWMANLTKNLHDDTSKLPKLVSKECKFGQWLNKDAKALIYDTDAFRKISALHKELHEYVLKITKTKDKSYYSHVESIHNELVEEMNKVIHQ